MAQVPQIRTITFLSKPIDSKQTLIELTSNIKINPGDIIQINRIDNNGFSTPSYREIVVFSGNKFLRGAYGTLPQAHYTGALVEVFQRHAKQEHEKGVQLLKLWLRYH